MEEIYILPKFIMKATSKILPLATVLVVFLLGYFGMRCGIDPKCPLVVPFSSLAFSLLKPAWVFSLISLPAGIALLFANKRVFKTWLVFTAYWLPLSFMAIYIFSSSQRGLMPLYSYSPGTIAIIMASLFTAISLVIIGWKQFFSKK